MKIPIGKGIPVSNRAVLMPLLFLGLMWFGFLLQSLNLITGCTGGIIPLTFRGLAGIIFSPFLHGDLGHIAGNSLSLAVLAFLLYSFYPKAASKVVINGWLLSGFMVWLFPVEQQFGVGRYFTCIIGASGVIYVMAFFLLASGIIRWNLKLLSVSLIVALYYGSMIWGMIPEELLFSLEAPSHIAWQAHLFGGIIGLVMAFLYQDLAERRKRYIWEYPNYYSEKDDELWMRYKRAHPEDWQEMPGKKKEESIWDYLEELRKKEWKNP